MQISDHSDIAAAQQRMDEAVAKMADMVSDVAHARQVKEYDSDRRKRALSVIMARHIMEGDSAAAAETKARASKEYATEMGRLGEVLMGAEKVVAMWEVSKIQYEAARSVLSIQKATMAAGV